MFLIYIAIGVILTMYALNFKTVNAWIITNVMAAKEMWAKYRSKP